MIAQYNLEADACETGSEPNPEVEDDVVEEKDLTQVDTSIDTSSDSSEADLIETDTGFTAGGRATASSLTKSATT